MTCGDTSSHAHCVSCVSRLHGCRQRDASAARRSMGHMHDGIAVNGRWRSSCIHQEAHSKARCREPTVGAARAARRCDAFLSWEVQSLSVLSSQPSPEKRSSTPTGRSISRPVGVGARSPNGSLASTCGAANSTPRRRRGRATISPPPRGRRARCGPRSSTILDEAVESLTMRG